jgi:hypothetical protein
MPWPEVAPLAPVSIPHSHPIGHTRKDTAYTPLPKHGATNHVLSFDSDVTFIAVGHRIIGLMPWGIVEVLGKEVRSGPRWVGEVLSGTLGHA